MTSLYPGLPLLAGAALMPFLNVAGRRVVSLLAPVLCLALLVLAGPDAGVTLKILDHEWIFWQADAMGGVFALAFALYGLIAAIYAWSETGRAAKTASLALTAGGVGVALAGDLLALYFFWEVLTGASVLLIWLGGGRGAIRAGFHYLMVHMVGGICFLTGALLHLHGGGRGLSPIGLDGPEGWLILTGLLINAAVPPLHAWLSDAYPRASICGTVFLAAFTTKAAVCVLARLFPGVELLVWGGVAMALYGVVFAVLENDIRRLLAYHIISQVGYMVCGIGLGTGMAVNGAVAHAFCHIFYKGLLMMSAGAVIHATGRQKLSDLGMLAGPLRWTLVFCMIGAFSISGVPLFNGFVSKSMVVSAAAEAHRGAAELLLIVASMGTFLHTGLKLPWFTFFGKDNGARVRRPVPRSMYLAMGLSAFVCVLVGVMPGLLYGILPNPVDYHPYTANHVLTSLQLLTGTALGFWLLQAKLGGQRTQTLDTDRLYRAPARLIAAALGRSMEAAGARSDQATQHLLSQCFRGRRTHASHRLVPQITVTIVTFTVVVALLISLS